MWLVIILYCVWIFNIVTTQSIFVQSTFFMKSLWVWLDCQKRTRRDSWNRFSYRLDVLPESQTTMLKHSLTQCVGPSFPVDSIWAVMFGKIIRTDLCRVEWQMCTVIHTHIWAVTKFRFRLILFVHFLFRFSIFVYFGVILCYVVCVVFFAFVVLMFVLSVLAIRLAGKNVSKMTYFVLSGT